jgi:diguanylate cyclase (GGDEF)-like protein/PAS domain S-box-containing protein
MALSSPDGTVLAANPAYCELYGYKIDEVVGHSFSIIFPAEERAAAEEVYREVFCSPIASVGYETEIRRADGTVRDVESRAAFIEQDGVRTAMVSTIRDVTERKRVEAELREAEDQFRGAFEAAVIGMSLVAPDGRYLRVNRALCELLDYSEEELLTKTFQELTHPDDLAADLALTNRLLAGEVNSFGMEKRYLRRDGAIVWAQLAISLVRDQTGAPRHLVGQIEDVTPRKEMEAALRESEERFRVQYWNNPVPIMSWRRVGDDFVLINHNAAMVAFSHGLTSRLIGRSASELYKNRPDMAADLARCFAERRAFRRELEWVMQSTGELKKLVVTCVYVPPDMVMVHIEDVTEQRHLEAALRHQATHDPLTGLPNRTLFREQLELAMENIHEGTLLAVLFLDLDQFKHVNDRFDHAVGDDLLVRVAKRLRECLDPAATISRQGGDEFTILLPTVAELSEANGVAASLLATLVSPVEVAGKEIIITGSVGIALSEPGIHAGELLRRADVALHEAKAQGRGRTVPYDVVVDRRAEARHELRLALHHALDRGEFVLYYQPIIDLQSGQVVALEALLRWLHPERGLMLPDEFLAVAEETGLIVPIGAWALESACHVASTWAAVADEQVPTVNFNLSARQLREPGLPDLIRQVLDESGLAADRLRLEVTEHALVDETPVVTRLLWALGQLGVGLAFDDFGVDYASLAHLRQLRFDTIKIDRSVISELGRDQHSSAVIRAVVALARDLGIEVTAEGIETVEQLRLARELGCDLGQGFLVAQPMTAEDLERWSLPLLKNGSPDTGTFGVDSLRQARLIC